MDHFIKSFDKDDFSKHLVTIIQHTPILQRIFQDIDQAGGVVLLVGGAIRDYFLGKDISDLDFEIYKITFDQLKTILKKYGQQNYVGKSFGVLRLNGIDADWSIPRKDSSGRKPVVDLDPWMSYEKAFRRRDLTINSMGVDLISFELIDPFNGLSDLRNRVLKASDNNFFGEDPLRFFRVMQFISRLEMNPADDLNKVCKKINLLKVSIERIDNEFEKMFLRSERPSLGINWLSKIGRLSEILGDFDHLEKLLKAIDLFVENHSFNIDQKLASFWALILLHRSDLKKVDTDFSRAEKETLSSYRQILKRYILKKNIVKTSSLTVYFMQYIPELIDENDLSKIKWLAFFTAPDISLRLLAVVASSFYSEKVGVQFLELANQAGVSDQPEKPLLLGRDLLKYAEGKELGILLEKAYQIQLNQSIKIKDQLLKILLKFVS